MRIDSNETTITLTSLSLYLGVGDSIILDENKKFIITKIDETTITIKPTRFSDLFWFRVLLTIGAIAIAGLSYWLRS